MNISIATLEEHFTRFSSFIATKDGKPFTAFGTSAYIDAQENYKYTVYESARDALANKFWRESEIGTGKIQERVNAAIQTRVNHRYHMVDNNLVDWRKKDDFSKLEKSVGMESILFNFYKSKIKDSLAFDQLLQNGLTYQFIAYLFFIKDRDRFMPITQEKFDRALSFIGLPDFKTSGRASWDNYNSYNELLKQVRDFLKTKDPKVQLLDAHTSLYMLSSQMQDKVLSHAQSATAALPPLPIAPPAVAQSVSIAEEDEELTFPEGKEVFRLHRSKERNRELVNAAKAKRLQSDEHLQCEACGFSFLEKYGDLGAGFIEAHHLFPLSELTEETETRIDDLALVCSNCHRMLHRKRPWLALEDLKALIK